MKTYNTKLGVRVFAIIAALDVVELIIGHYHPGGLLIKPAVIVNAPAILLRHFFEGFFQTGSLVLSGLFIGSLVFTAILWSLIAGYVFGRRVAA
jgi:hypothetical protein